MNTSTPWPRLLTLIGLLVVMFMIMNRAKDPRTWQWLTTESDLAGSTESDVEAGDGTSDDDRANQEDGYVLSPIQIESLRPTDRDPEELEAAREEFQAISDRAPMLREEMPSYWRLLNWARNQSIDELERRARKPAIFTDFVEAPDGNRGKLVHLRLHVMRSLSYETPDSPIGVKRLYEAWGWTDESGPWLYVVVFPERPPGMPIGPDAHAEISFDGYFLKLMSYEPRQSTGKSLFAPLLLGRVVWHPVQTTPVASRDTWFWITAGVGGVAALIMILRWVLVARYSRTRPEPVSSQQEVAVVTWLQQAEAAPEEREQSERPLTKDD